MHANVSAEVGPVRLWNVVQVTARYDILPASEWRAGGAAPLSG
jgi:hypothetical protein